MNTAPARTGRGVVPVVAASALCLGVGASMGFVPAFLATTLRDDLGIGRGQVGLLVSLHFGCTGLGSIMGGRVTERYGARAVIVADMALVAASAFFGVWVGAYWALVVASIVAGTAYSLVNAGTNVAIGRTIGPSRRTLAMSVKTAGVPTMAMFAAAAGPPVASRSSWQSIIAVVGVVAVVAVVVAGLVFDDDRPTTRAAPQRAALPAGIWWYSLGAFLLIAGSQPLYSWTVAYLEQSLDASPGVAGGVSALASGVGVVVMIAAAQHTDRVGPDGRVRRLMILIAINLVGTMLVLVGEAFGVWLVAIGAVVGISAQLSAIGTMHAAVVDRAPQAVAGATGVTMTGYYIGALASPAAFGWLADATDTFAWSWGATALLLTIALPVWHIAGRTGRGVANPVITSEPRGVPT